MTVLNRLITNTYIILVHLKHPIFLSISILWHHKSIILLWINPLRVSLYNSLIYILLNWYLVLVLLSLIEKISWWRILIYHPYILHYSYIYRWRSFYRFIHILRLLLRLWLLNLSGLGLHELKCRMLYLVHFRLFIFYTFIHILFYFSTFFIW